MFEIVSRNAANKETRMMYRAFGLRILSEIPFNEIPETVNEVDVDVVIEYDGSEELWHEFSHIQKSSIVKKDLFMLNLPGIARFSVMNGNKIIVSPAEGSDQDQIRLYILGTCMGVLLMQRRVLPLHGSAIAIGGKAYAFVGESGAGKSSLAAAFLDRGYLLLSDDLIPVSFSEQDGVPFVIPSYPQQKLWEESLTEFGMTKNYYRPIFQRENKYAIPAISAFCSQSLPLAGVFEIKKTDTESIKIDRIEGLQRLHTLLRHTYRNFFIKDSGLMQWHFDVLTSTVDHIDIFRLQRPTCGFTAFSLTSLVLATLFKE